MPIHVTKPEPGPLALAAKTAQEVSEAAEEAWQLDDTAIAGNHEAASWIEMVRRENEALDAHRAFLASDEPRHFRYREDGCEIEFWASSTEEAIEHAEELLQEGDYGDVTETFWPSAVLSCEDGSVHTVRVTIDPEAPACSEGKEHDWQSPIELVGGIAENPGVWGHGGGVKIHEACMNCGCGRVRDTWAQDQTTGEQGLESVSYEEGRYTLPELPEPEVQFDSTSTSV